MPFLIVEDVLEAGFAARIGVEEGRQLRHPDIDQQALARYAVTLHAQDDGSMLDAAQPRPRGRSRSP